MFERFKNQVLVLAFIVFQLLFSKSIQAQDSIDIQFDNINLNRFINYNYPVSNSFSLNNSTFYKPQMHIFSPILNLENAFLKKAKLHLSYNAEKQAVHYQGLGSIEHFNNQFTVQYANKLSLKANFGLAKQSFFLNPDYSDYLLNSKYSLEYEINNNLKAYIYWQNITPINKPNIEFEPFENMQTLFLNNEFGGGIRTQFNGIKTDIGINASYSSKFNNERKINTVNTKISLDF